MALPALATVDQLEGWIGQTIDGGDTRAEFALGVASTLVRSHTGLPWVDSEGALSVDLPDAVWQVTVMAAARLYENPRGVTQETTGPFSLSMSNGGDDGPALYLTKSEKSMLDDPEVLGETSRRGLFVLDTTRGDYVDGTGREASYGEYWLPTIPTL